jgi:hypothetical protein
VGHYIYGLFFLCFGNERSEGDGRKKTGVENALCFELVEEVGDIKEVSSKSELG